MNNIWNVTPREWLAFICHGYIDSLGNFHKIKNNALTLHQAHNLDQDSDSAICEAIRSAKAHGCTKNADIISKHGAYTIYTAKSVIDSLSRNNHNPFTKLGMDFFGSCAESFTKAGAFEPGKSAKCRSIDQMYVVEVDASASTDTEYSGADTEIRFLIDGINRLTLVQERLIRIYTEQSTLGYAV